MLQVLKNWIIQKYFYCYLDNKKHESVFAHLNFFLLPDDHKFFSVVRPAVYFQNVACTAAFGELQYANYKNKLLISFSSIMKTFRSK